MTGRLAPGSRGWPLLGHLIPFARDPIGFAREQARRHGDVVRVDLGRPALLLAHPDHARAVLQERASRYGRSFLHELFRPLGGQGILTSEGELWQRQRRMMQPAFSPAALAERLPGWSERAAEACAARLAAAEGGEVDVGREVTRAALEVAGHALFGVDLTRDRRIRPAVEAVLEILGERQGAVLSTPAWLPTPSALRFRRAVRDLDRVVLGIIAERRAEAGGAASNALDRLLAATDEGRGMSDRQLRDEVITLLVAGHETVATTLAWALYLLACHPEVQAAVAEEDDPQRPQATAVLHETLRLYPPGFVLSRRALEEDEIGGYRVAVGTTVMMFLPILQRRPDFWERPDEFDPRRFGPGWQREVHRGAYLPFGLGPRQCIGNHFSMIEMTRILGYLARRLVFAPARPLEPEVGLTLHPRRPATLRVRART